MSVGKIDFKKQIIDHVQYCQGRFNDKMKVAAAELGASLAQAMAIGNTEVLVEHIPENHDLVKSGKLIETMREAAKAENPSIRFSYTYDKQPALVTA